MSVEDAGHSSDEEAKSMNSSPPLPVGATGLSPDEKTMFVDTLPLVVNVPPPNNNIPPLNDNISSPNDNADITTQRHGRTWWAELRYWKTELMCWAAGFVCLGGIVGIFFPYHNKPLPHLPWQVKLNTIASILATFANALLLAPVSSALGQLKWNWYCVSRPIGHFDKLDQASRGAWGSLKMLFSRLAFSLAVIGAIWTILSLALGPFVQQVITYPQRTVLMTDTSVPVAIKFGNTTQTNSSPEPYVQGAIYSGLYADLDARIQVAPSCSTGHCAFNDSITLAVCSECLPIEPTRHDNFTTILQNNFSLTFANPQNVVLLNISNTLSDYASIGYPQKGSLLLDFFGIMNGSGFECILQWCVHELRATEVDGKYNETVLSTWSNNSLSAAGVQNLGNPASDPGAPIPEITYYFTNSSSSPTTFQVGSSQQSILSGFLAGMFNGGVHDVGPNHLPGYISAPTVPQALYQSLSSGIAPNVTALSQVMSNIAASLSVAIRNNAEERYNITGKTLSDETYVHVDWKWLAFPFGLAFLALLFLGLVILDTRKKARTHGARGLAVSKNDSLPVLMYGLDAAVRQRMAERGCTLEL